MSKRVLVTGGAGFLGSYVIDLLLKKTDWEIVSLDRLNYSGNLNRLEETLREHSPETKKRVSIVFHDFKAPISGQVKSAIGDINVVLHIGANSHVDHSIADPVLFLLDNTLGTVNMLEYARTLSNLECFYYFSTDEVLGNLGDGDELFSENDRTNPKNPYAAAKLGGENFCVAYHNTYALPVIISRCMNIFGRRQAPDKFIPLCIRNICDGLPITIHANEDCTQAGARYYIHGDDVAEAVLFILTSPTIRSHIKRIKHDTIKCPRYHIVGQRRIDNLELAQTIANIQQKPLDYTLVDFHSSRPGHDKIYGMSGKLLESLGWKPSVSVEQRLKETVEWSLANPRWLAI